MKTIAIVSGGMDSVTLMYFLRDRGDEVAALGFDYGQRHRKELDAGAALAAGAGVPFEVVDLRAVSRLIGGESSQLNPAVDVPEGHYTEDSMRATVVPNRNMIMLSVAIGHAVAAGFDAVAYGAHAGDHAIYPDCRESFAAAMAEAARLCDWRPIELLRPFVAMTKGDIARLGGELGVPLGSTWSCYKGLELHCGRCGTCVERREAFAAAELADPTTYAS